MATESAYCHFAYGKPPSLSAAILLHREVLVCPLRNWSNANAMHQS